MSGFTQFTIEQATISSKLCLVGDVPRIRRAGMVYYSVSHKLTSAILYGLKLANTPTSEKLRYEDGVTTLLKVGLVSYFIWSENPLNILGSVGQLSFEDPACSSIKDNELTTEEIKSLCEDLYVLDKHGFKQLLKDTMLQESQKLINRNPSEIYLNDAYPCSMF
ncbi:adoMet-dependent rRNA methyltransferase spb1-like [Asparagus officinalis]|uniref:adoMet-dependent rRNA methyltransferase spb1-like n=1 Tax=Asparagus officinalis TaxID=4686 RepID=UPI00098E5E5C|nr:adoMet-dependent rRNA methyltransferase spb1-like [Asparagus officinalis]